MTNSDWLAREHDDPYLDERAPLAIDRDRIVHSAAFRRLQYKTQVFVAPRGDHFRSRLTHTLEVAGLARRIADCLGLDADLAEVAALAHDLGHPPFGHAGERALHAAMQQHGGRFEHNEQTLRVVTYLEHPYPEFRGLNLTAGVRAALRTHRTRYDQPQDQSSAAPAESAVVNVADQLAYTLHDLQDGLYAGMIDPDDLAAIRLWQQCYRGPARPRRSDCLRHLRPTLQRMEALLIGDLQRNSRSAAGGAGPAEVALSAQSQELLDELGAMLSEQVYQHRQVVRMDDKAFRMVSAIFEAYVNKPQLMPARYAARVDDEGVPRVVADYVAGMTDRFCSEEYGRLFDASLEV